MTSWKRKKPAVQRTPNIERQKQTSFHYSSNRAQADRVRNMAVDQESNVSGYVELRDQVLRLPVLLSGIAVLILCVFLGSLSGDPKVIITGDSPPMRKVAIYNRAVEETVNDNVLNNSKFFLNRQQITEHLQSSFPELKNIKVNTPFFERRAVIQAEISQPILLLATANKEILINSEGIAVADLDDSSITLKPDGIPLLQDQSNTPIKIGKPGLTSSQVAFITELRRQSEAKKLEFDSMSLEAGGGELTVKHTEANYKVRYNMYEDARKSFGTFFAAKERAEKTSSIPKEYIDVRIPERAYIK